MQTSSLPLPTAIIFDWDNTLVNTWPVIHAALNATFTEYGLPTWTIEQTHARVKKSMRDAFPVIFGDDWQAAGKAYQTHYRARHLSDLAPIGGAEQTLKAVREAGIVQLIVSNKTSGNLRKEIDHLGWRHYFAGISGATDAAHDKPHRAAVQFALNQLDAATLNNILNVSATEQGEARSGGFGGSAPIQEEIWFVGDTDIDLECAANADCVPILFGEHAKAHPKYTPTHLSGQAFARHVVDHDEFRELLHFVR